MNAPKKKRSHKREGDKNQRKVRGKEFPEVFAHVYSDWGGGSQKQETSRFWSMESDGRKEPHELSTRKGDSFKERLVKKTIRNFGAGRRAE